MDLKKDKVSIKGKSTAIDSININGKKIIVLGKILKIARVKDDICDNGINNPEVIVEKLRETKKADIFTFDQKLPNIEPKFNFYFEWDNLAVIEIKSFEYWWTKQIGNDARRRVRKAEKQGVATKTVPFSDEFVSGIKQIYDETPIRQRKAFWHYNKTFSEVKADNASFLERSDFIGAYLGDELIGFTKIIYIDCWAVLIQLISKLKYKDKGPANALVAKAVEICAEKGIRFLTYGAYIYGRKGADSLTDFKRHNGFVKIDYPRYYVPLTAKGKIALSCGFHKSIIEILPIYLVDILLKARTKYYQLVYSTGIKSW